MIRLNFVLSLVFLSGCSAIQFASKNSLPVNMNYSEDDSTEVSIEVSKPFYLWGMVPTVQVVNIDEEFAEKGFRSVSDLRITEIYTTEKFLWMLFTFGMYYPNSYKLVASSN